MLSVTLKSGRVELEDVPRPEPQESSDAIVMVTTAAIGHWEIEAVRQSETVSAPGTQFAGTVVETGTAVEQLALDDLVLASCFAPVDSGVLLAGGHAEYVRVPDADRSLVKTTAAAEERSVFAGGEAVLGVRAATRALDTAGDGLIVVMGCDTAALSAIAWLSHKRGRSGRTAVIESDAATLAAAKSLGAREMKFDDLAGSDVAAIVTGMSVRSAPSNAPIVSTCVDEGDLPRFDEVRRTEMAIRLRQLELAPVVSTVLPLDDAVEAYRLAVERPPGIRGVLLKP